MIYLLADGHMNAGVGPLDSNVRSDSRTHPSKLLYGCFLHYRGWEACDPQKCRELLVVMKARSLLSIVGDSDARYGLFKKTFLLRAAND